MSPQPIPDDLYGSPASPSPMQELRGLLRQSYLFSAGHHCHPILGLVHEVNFLYSPFTQLPRCGVFMQTPSGDVTGRKEQLLLLVHFGELCTLLFKAEIIEFP